MQNTKGSRRRRHRDPWCLQEAAGKAGAQGGAPRGPGWRWGRLSWRLRPRGHKRVHKNPEQGTRPGGSSELGRLRRAPSRGGLPDPAFYPVSFVLRPVIPPRALSSRGPRQRFTWPCFLFCVSNATLLCCLLIWRRRSLRGAGWPCTPATFLLPCALPRQLQAPRAPRHPQARPGPVCGIPAPKDARERAARGLCAGALGGGGAPCAGRCCPLAVRAETSWAQSPGGRACAAALQTPRLRGARRRACGPAGDPGPLPAPSPRRARPTLGCGHRALATRDAEAGGSPLWSRLGKLGSRWLLVGLRVRRNRTLVPDCAQLGLPGGSRLSLPMGECIAQICF